MVPIEQIVKLYPFLMIFQLELRKLLKILIKNIIDKINYKIIPSISGAARPTNSPVLWSIGPG